MSDVGGPVEVGAGTSCVSASFLLGLLLHFCDFLAAEEPSAESAALLVDRSHSKQKRL